MLSHHVIVFNSQDENVYNRENEMFKMILSGLNVFNDTMTMI